MAMVRAQHAPEVEDAQAAADLLTGERRRVEVALAGSRAIAEALVAIFPGLSTGISAAGGRGTNPDDADAYVETVLPGSQRHLRNALFEVGVMLSTQVHDAMGTEIAVLARVADATTRGRAAPTRPPSARQVDALMDKAAAALAERMAARGLPTPPELPPAPPCRA